jgi:hypothetical protein
MVPVAQIHHLQSGGVSPTAQPANEQQLWEDWSLCPLQNGRRRSQVRKWGSGEEGSGEGGR